MAPGWCFAKGFSGFWIVASRLRVAASDFGIIFRRRRSLLNAMASTSPAPGLNDQQVMTAQSTNNPPQGVDAAVARMEGETAGPNYNRQQAGKPQLPNGVPHPSLVVARSADMQSLPYSPMRHSGAGESSGLLGEVWPTQPQRAASSG